MNLKNPFRGQNKSAMCPVAPFPSIDSDRPLQLLSRCPEYKETPLHQRQIEPIKGKVFIKDERVRMGLGSFKALGSLCDRPPSTKEKRGRHNIRNCKRRNHGLSVAAGAQIFGARSVVYLSHTVPETFAEKLRLQGQRSAVKVMIMRLQ